MMGQKEFWGDLSGWELSPIMVVIMSWSLESLAGEWLPGLFHYMLGDRRDNRVRLFVELLRVPVAFEPTPLRVSDLRNPVSSCSYLF